ncbi:MAG: class I SAM-dependent methyltransferase [Thermomicrobiales bacterium]
MPSTARYDAIASEYDRWSSPDGRDLDDPTLDALLDIRAGERVCAVACGAGREARFLAQRGAIVTGVDLSAGLLAIAQEREAAHPLGITYQQGNAEDLKDLADASFDGVVCYMALMDIPDLGRTLHAIARILVPGGWFVFAITHPCFKTPAYGEIVDHVDGSVRRTVGRYFDEGAWDGPGKGTDHLPAMAYHRTLSTYVNTLVEAGLAIEAMREPQLDTPVWRQAACVLYARCQKVS